MENIYLLKFNNPYNNICVKYDYLEEYPEESVQLLNTNFVPGDGVNTSHIFNASKGDVVGCDYCIVCDTENNIISRWYIISHERTRNGQYKLSLLRDVIADFRDNIMESTAYIRRGTLPSDNNLIFNSEGITYNQIKKREDYLYDRTGRPWIVGYTDPSVALKDATINFSKSLAPLNNIEELREYEKNPLKVIAGTPTLHFYVVSPEQYREGIQINKKNYLFKFSIAPGSTTPTYEKTKAGSGLWVSDTSDGEVLKNALISQLRDQGDRLSRILSQYESNVNSDNIYMPYNGKIVYDLANQKYYSISVSSTGSSSETSYPRKTDAATNKYYEEVVGLITPAEHITERKFGVNEYSQSSLGITYNVQTYSLKLVPIDFGDAAIKFGDNGSLSRKKLKDAPYSMFAMPYTEVNYMLAIQFGISNQGNIKDIQLLPYCPVLDYYPKDKLDPYGRSIPDITGLEEGTDFVFMTVPGDQLSGENAYTDIMFWCEKAEGTFDIPYVINVEDVKIESECDMYRLCSPNGNGVFEFNAAKNYGVLSFNVDYTYRPYDPYIHVNPNFGGLYGEDFNDFRGLILNGDFSIPMITDAWAQYIINNKNYQNIFNREIQSMELQRDIANKMDIWQAIAGTLSGGVSGAGAGMFMGGPWGAVAGAAVGTVASGIGGIADIHYNRQLRQEQINLKQDLFKYQIGNIQALPQSVSKTGCKTNNNKLVPYVEYYTCTDEEKDMLKQMIKYTGVSIGTSGQIKDYVSVGMGFENPQPITADIIEIDLNEDYHTTMEIVKTLQGGIRLG